MVVTEKQGFKGTFLMYVVLLIELPTLVLLITLYFMGKFGEDGWVHLLVIIGIMGIAMGLIMSLRLETRMDAFGFSFRNLPFMTGWRKIKKEDIDSISIHKMDGMLEYGGVGIRIFPKTKAYIYFADHVIKIKQGNRQLVFSTKKHMEFESLILEWKNT